VGVLQRFERRVERLVNGAFARAFKAEVEPVEIASALQRECDDRAAIVSRGRTMVPNTFVVELGASDHERLSRYAEPLGAELADMVGEHAAEQHYSFVGPVTVTFEQSDELETGRFRVRSAAVAVPNPAGAPRAPSPTPARPAARPPAIDGPYLEVNSTRVPLVQGRTVIGRAPECDVRIEDLGISRQHAEIRLTPGRATIVDLGSTNGVVVDGFRRRRSSWPTGCACSSAARPSSSAAGRRGRSDVVAADG
jgi:hypothetical protein